MHGSQQPRCSVALASRQQACTAAWSNAANWSSDCSLQNVVMVWVSSEGSVQGPWPGPGPARTAAPGVGAGAGVGAPPSTAGGPVAGEGVKGSGVPDGSGLLAAAKSPWMPSNADMSAGVSPAGGDDNVGEVGSACCSRRCRCCSGRVLTCQVSLLPGSQ